MAAAKVTSRNRAKPRGLLFTTNRRKQRPAINNDHCSCTWWRPNQESVATFTTSGLPPLPRRVRWRPRARNNWEAKAKGQMRRQSSWLSSTIINTPLGTTTPQNRRLPG